jgi:glycosyltransferase involved in cell wall biosynthesis
MAPKKILLVGMLDSIHVGRWLSQFESTETEFVLFPSKKFRNLNPVTHALLSHDSKVDLRLYSRWVPKSLLGYFDFAVYVLPSRIKMSIRVRSLRNLINRNEFDYIHGLEIQGAGYLLERAFCGSKKSEAKVIITNWGSDIYYFKDYPEHKKKIESVLKIADYYSAECKRDYVLARDLGFTGQELPCIPNAGGFHIAETTGSITSSRRQIIVKCYGGQFGRGSLIIQALHKVLPEFNEYGVLLYSVTSDLIEDVQILSMSFPGRVNFASQNNPIPHRELLLEFEKSRVYIGASISDGISTSFLEALIHGAYPIQTNTSCANEWISKGAIGSIVGLEFEALLETITKALRNSELVDEAAIKNFEIAQTYLGLEVIKRDALKFYSID